MARGARERLHPGRDRQGRRGARQRHRPRPHRAHRRLGLPACSPTTASRSSRTPPFDPVVKGGTSVAPLLPRRLAEPFERLRDAADAHLRPDRQAAAGVPRLPRRSRRALRARDLDAELPGRRRHRGDRQRRRCTTPPTPARPSPTAARRVACICSSDQVYAELAEATAGALKQAGAAQVLLAGRPKAQEAALKAAGVDTLHLRRRRCRRDADEAARGAGRVRLNRVNKLHCA